MAEKTETAAAPAQATKPKRGVAFGAVWGNLDADGKRELANRCETTTGYLSQVAHGRRYASVAMAKLIEKHTNRVVRRTSLVSDKVRSLLED